MNGDKRRFPCFLQTCSACSVIPVQKRTDETSRVTILSPRARDFAPTSPQTLAERHDQSPCLQPGQHGQHSCTPPTKRRMLCPGNTRLFAVCRWWRCKQLRVWLLRGQARHCRDRLQARCPQRSQISMGSSWPLTVSCRTSTMTTSWRRRSLVCSQQVAPNQPFRLGPP